MHILTYFDSPTLYQRRCRCGKETLRINRIRVVNVVELCEEIGLSCDIDKITSETLLDYVREEESRKRVEQITIKRQCETVRSVVRYAIRDGLAMTSPEIPFIRVPSPKPKPYSAETLDRYIRHAVNMDGPIRRGFLADFVALAYVTGLRVSDLLRLNSSHIQDNSIRLSSGKVEKHHMIPLPEWCVRRFRRVQGKLLPINYDYLVEQLRSSSLDARTDIIMPQRLRVTSANFWQETGDNAGFVILGHALPGSSAATPNYLAAWQTLQRKVHLLRCPSEAFLTVAERNERHKLDAELSYLLPKLAPDQLDMLVRFARGLAG